MLVATRVCGSTEAPPVGLAHLPVPCDLWGDIFIPSTDWNETASESPVVTFISRVPEGKSGTVGVDGIIGRSVLTQLKKVFSNY